MNDIKTIDEFLSGWKKKACEYYSKLHNEYINQRSTEYEVTEDSLREIPKDYYTLTGQKYTDDKIAKIVADIENGESWAGGIPVQNLKAEIATSKFFLWKKNYSKSEIDIIERMNKKGYLDSILDLEVKRKKQALIARVEKKAGKITDANYLALGNNGEINGFIIGEKAKVSVHTVFAGGYNVQCLHYRVLVKVIS